MRAVGEYTAAKLDFLQRAMRQGGHGVNRKWCPPLHPHGKRMLDQGLITLHRDGLPKSRTSYIKITETGIAELRRLEKRLGVPPTKAAPMPDEDG